MAGYCSGLLCLSGKGICGSHRPYSRGHKARDLRPGLFGPRRLLGRAGIGGPGARRGNEPMGS